MKDRLKMTIKLPRSRHAEQIIDAWCLFCGRVREQAIRGPQYFGPAVLSIMEQVRKGQT